MSPKYTKILETDEQTLIVSGMNESMNFIYTQFKLRNSQTFVKRFRAYMKAFDYEEPMDFVDKLFSVDYFYGGSAYFNSPVLLDSFFS